MDWPEQWSSPQNKWPVNTSLEPKLRGSRRRASSLPSRPQKMIPPVTKQLPPSYRHRWSIISHRHLKTTSSLLHAVIISSVNGGTLIFVNYHSGQPANCDKHILKPKQVSVGKTTTIVHFRPPLPPPPLCVRQWVIKRENLWAIWEEGSLVQISDRSPEVVVKYEEP